MRKRDGEKIDEYQVVSNVEAGQIVQSLCEIEPMLALSALSGLVAGVPEPERENDRPKMYRRDKLVKWCGTHKAKLAEAAKARLHKDSVGRLPSQAKLSEAGDYAVSFDNAGVYQGHSASEKL